MQTVSAQVKKPPVAGKKPAPAAARTVKPVVGKKTIVEITTDFGIMHVMLYDSTPLHKANFLKLVREGFYDSLLFHRVIQGFMIQGGDPASKNAEPGQMLGNGSAPGERIPAEFRPYYVHKKGALAAARDNNPERASSNCQFYIVQGKSYTDIDLNKMECTARSTNPAFTYTPQQRANYRQQGGTPFLDQNYTVFGEVIKGLEVIDKIAAVSKGASDRPTEDVRMKMRIISE